MEVRVLGPVDVRHDGSSVTLRGAKPRQLLALLAKRANRPVAGEVLIDELWDGDPPPSAATALRVHVGRLRQVLEPDRNASVPSVRLPAGPSGYLLRVEPDELDAQRFERLLVLAREANLQGDPACSVAHLTQALDLWRGPAFVDICDLSVARTEIAALDELRVVAIEELADARLSLGEHALVVDVLMQALEEFPLREGLTAHLMVALYRCGRQADALRAYAELAQQLDAQLAVPPSAALRRLEADVLLQDSSLDFVPSKLGSLPRLHARALGLRFIGRREELSRLERAHEQVPVEGPRLVLVSGPAGIGKTTLVEEFCARVAREGTVPLVGTCDSDASGDYQPLVEILAGVLERLDGARRKALPPELSVLVPSLETESTASVPVQPSDAESSRFRLFEAVATALIGLAEIPTVLVIEDLHWADRPTLSLLRHLLRHPGLDGLLIVATFRDDEVGAERGEMIDRLAPQARVESVQLDRFSDNEVRALVRATAPPETMHTLGRLAVTLQEVTGGNPFFLRELLRELDDVRVTLADNGELVRTLETIAPAGVCALVDRRLGRLTDRSRRVACAAAVVGRDITVSLLTAICGLPTEDVFDSLEECLATRLLIEDGQHIDRYLFAHALIRNAVYATIEPRARQELHELTGDALEAGGVESTTHRVADVARHFCEAAPRGTTAKAALYCEQAGDEAAARFAFAEAARWYERCLMFHSQIGTDTAELGGIQLALGRVFACDKQHNRALEAFIAAADTARQAGDAALLADVALAADGPWSTGSDFQPVARELLEEALPRIADSDLPRRIRILNGIATDLYFVDPIREGAIAREAVELAEMLRDPTALATAQLALHRWYTHQPAAVSERLALARSARTLTEAVTSATDLNLRIQRELLADLLENGDVAEFDLSLAEYEQRAIELGSPRDLYWSMALRATQADLHGDLAAAEQFARGAELRGHELEQLSAGAALLQRFVIRFQQARLAEELPVLRLVGETQSVFRAGASLRAVALSETGRVDRALDLAWATVGPDGGSLSRDVFWLAAMCLFAAVAATGEDDDLNHLLTDLLQPCADHVVVFGAGGAVLGCGHHWLGGLAAARGDLDPALHHFSEAVALAERIEAPFWVAQATIDLARVLRQRDRRADAPLIDRCIADARSVAEVKGYGRVLALADSLA